jgi:hypothetical protein
LKPDSNLGVGDGSMLDSSLEISTTRFRTRTWLRALEMLANS